MCSTVENGQTSVTIKIYEGESTVAKDNHSLGLFNLSDIPPAPRGVPKIEVTFEIDVNGILKVSAEDKTTGNKNNIIISNQNRLSSAEIMRMVEYAEMLAYEDQKLKEEVQAKEELESYVYTLKNQVNHEEILGSKLTNEEKEKIEAAVQDKINWLESNTDAKVNDYKKQKKQVEEIVTPIITRFHKTADGSALGGELDLNGDGKPHENELLSWKWKALVLRF